MILKKDIRYSNRITICALAHMMRMVDHMTICVETLRQDIGCSLKNKFAKIICMNPRMVLYLTTNQVDSQFYMCSFIELRHQRCLLDGQFYLNIFPHISSHKTPHLQSSNT